MYYRLFNSLDAKILIESFQTEHKCYSSHKMILDRISELIEILDISYGSHRATHTYGGSVLFFLTEESYTKTIDKILDFYHLNPELSEYDDVLGKEETDNVEWHEQMWLLSSDDAIVMVYPKGVRKSV